MLHCFYINDETSERENKKKILLKIMSKKIKYLGINLTKGVKDLCTENCKALIKETKNYSKKWEAIQCSWIRINIIKMAIQSNL